MQNLNLWRKAENAISDLESRVKFTNVKREAGQPKQRVIKKKVPVFKKTKSIIQKKIKNKPQTICMHHAENELK